MESADNLDILGTKGNGREFPDKLAEATNGLKMGNGADEGVAVGPLINEGAANDVMTFVDDAVAGGAVVTAPDGLGRRERAGLEALVGVHVRRQEPRDVARVRELAGHELAHQRAHAELGLRVLEQVPGPLAVPQRGVDVA